MPVIYILWELVRFFYELLQVLKLSTMLHTFSNTLLLLFCLVTVDFTDRQNQHANIILYCNNYDTSSNLPKNVREN